MLSWLGVDLWWLRAKDRGELAWSLGHLSSQLVMLRQQYQHLSFCPIENICGKEFIKIWRRIKSFILYLHAWFWTLFSEWLFVRIKEKESLGFQMFSTFVRRPRPERGLVKGSVPRGFEGEAADYGSKAVWLTGTLMLAQLAMTKPCSLFLRATSPTVVCLTIQGHGVM